ncbi:polysaccharide deacetylase family protein, partial [Patescibacteria group bacterium]|nr:polysaccharide deacetylase family protein [Patescibacteria group bacterium]
KLGLKHVSGIFFSRRELWQPNAKSMAKAALKRAKPGTIMIFHDGWNAWGGNRAQTVKAIDLIIPELKARGYTFVTADQMLGIKPYQD